MTLQHRLFYSAIDLSYFIAEKDGHPSLYFHDPHSDSWNNYTSRLIPFFTRRLQSLNGPNRLSSDYSGGIFDANACHSTLKMEAEIFPGYHLANDADTEKLMHSLLKSRMAQYSLSRYSTDLRTRSPQKKLLIPSFWRTVARSTCTLRCTCRIMKPMQLHLKNSTDSAWSRALKTLRSCVRRGRATAGRRQRKLIRIRASIPPWPYRNASATMGFRLTS